jgi:hypothetical protein
LYHKVAWHARPFLFFTEVWEGDIVMKLSFIGNLKPYYSTAV